MLWSFYSNGANVRVGILSGFKPNSVLLITPIGNYEVYAQGEKICNFITGTNLTLTANQNVIQLKNADQIIGEYSQLRLVAIGNNNSFKIQVLCPLNGDGIYEDNLQITASNSILKLINSLDLDRYVAGVVESEAGHTQFSEFAKVQSIICRTYALGHFRRHASEGFQLCDNVHCQVYKGKCRFDAIILNAVKATSQKVICSKNQKLIIGAFYSNCGGQTCNSEDVWNETVLYLKSVTDTFCLHQPHATWTKEFTVKDWKTYLTKTSQAKFTNDSLKKDSTSFNRQVNQSPIYYIYKDAVVPLMRLRTDLGFRSTKFSITQKKDTLFFKGYGYGHGVGLCQEGAIRMAQLGYNYEDIIKFYFQDVRVINVDALSFLNE
jgi:stage II sporulation protein D